MNYRPQKINFRQVMRGDTFHVTLIMAPAYTITPETTIRMQVRPSGDIPENPVLIFDSEGESIAISGQEITLHQDVLDVRPGRFVYDIQFTTENITTTLVKGLFEIIDDATLTV